MGEEQSDGIDRLISLIVSGRCPLWGTEEWFPPPRLSDRCGFEKPSVAVDNG
jgi:hypothetical protein